MCYSTSHITRITYFPRFYAFVSWPRVRDITCCLRDNSVGCVWRPAPAHSPPCPPRSPALVHHCCSRDGCNVEGRTDHIGTADALGHPGSQANHLLVCSSHLNSMVPRLAAIKNISTIEHFQNKIKIAMPVIRWLSGKL